MGSLCSPFLFENTRRFFLFFTIVFFLQTLHVQTHFFLKIHAGFFFFSRLFFLQTLHVQTLLFLKIHAGFFVFHDCFFFLQMLHVQTLLFFKIHAAFFLLHFLFFYFHTRINNPFLSHVFIVFHQFLRVAFVGNTSTFHFQSKRSDNNPTKLHTRFHKKQFFICVPFVYIPLPK